MEEMSTYFRFKKNKYLSLCIRYGRSIDITNKLPVNYKNEIKENERIPFSKLPPKIQDIVKANLPLLIKDEKEILNSLGITSYLKPSCIYRIKKQKRIRAHWTLLIEKINSVELFHKYFSSNENENTPIKMKEFSGKFEIWKKYRGRKLNVREKGFIKEVSRKWQGIKRMAS